MHNDGQGNLMLRSSLQLEAKQRIDVLAAEFMGPVGLFVVAGVVAHSKGLSSVSAKWTGQCSRITPRAGLGLTQWTCA